MEAVSAASSVWVRTDLILPVRMSSHSSPTQPTNRQVNLSIYQPVNLSTCRSINLSTCRSINLSTCQSVCLIPGSTWYFFQNISFYCSTVQSTVFCLNFKHYHNSLPGFLMTVYWLLCVCRVWCMRIPAGVDGKKGRIYILQVYLTVILLFV